ncbi:MAG: hypothetical protein PHQ60_06880 [Sideroxydans sp.]|nr:hypothetical protein [Sideroxydans sp.]
MIRLDDALRAWGTPAFEAVFKRQVAQLGADQLPLQQGLSGSNAVADEPFTVVILSVAEQEKSIRVKAGIFYQGIISGCSCADDPAPDNTVNEYCEVLFVMDKCSALTAVSMVADQDNQL